MSAANKGIDYAGQISRTATGIECQVFSFTSKPIKKSKSKPIKKSKSKPMKNQNQNP